MSHLREYKLNLVDFKHLKDALKRLDNESYTFGQTIFLPQTETQSASFRWNGKSYTLFYDNDFWLDTLNIRTFTEKVRCEYSAEEIVHGMHDFGFRPESYTDSTKSDKYQTVKSKTLILNRYNFNKQVK